MQPNYLCDRARPRTAVAGVKAARAIAASRRDAPLVKREVKPGPRGRAATTRCCEFCRDNGATIFHPSGTCMMGAATRWPWSTSACACAASSGLRVVDCSVMPTLVSGNTNAPVVMMAEKAVDMIREDAQADSTTPHGAMTSL